MERLLKAALRNGISKGFLGGSRPWLIIGGIAAGWRVLRKIAGSEPIVVFSEELRPGEAFVIANGPEPR
jgi:hypothetical protein